MKPALLALLVLLLAAPASAQVDPYAHPCDQWEQRAKNMTDGKPAPIIYDPLVGEPITPWLCGPPGTGPLTYQMSVDGAPVPSHGVLVMAHWSNSDRQLPDAGTNGLVPYIIPGPLLTMPSPGLHTIRVVYGQNKVSVTFPMIGALAKE